MEFLKHCDNKNIVMECSEDIVVSEGWGTVLAKMGGLVGTVIGQRINLKKVKQMITEPKMAAYIKGECERILKEQKENDPSMDKNGPSGVFKTVLASLKAKRPSDASYGFLENMKHWRQYFVENDSVGESVGGFRIEALADNAHIQKVVLWLYSNDKEKFFIFNIPAPSDEELSKIFHKE